VTSELAFAADHLLVRSGRFWMPAVLELPLERSSAVACSVLGAFRLQRDSIAARSKIGADQTRLARNAPRFSAVPADPLDHLVQETKTKSGDLDVHDN